MKGVIDWLRVVVIVSIVNVCVVFGSIFWHEFVVMNPGVVSLNLNAFLKVFLAFLSAFLAVFMMMFAIEAMAASHGERLKPWQVHQRKCAACLAHKKHERVFR